MTFFIRPSPIVWGTLAIRGWNSGGHVKGPDAKRLLEYLSPCTFSNLSTNPLSSISPARRAVTTSATCILNYYGEDEGFELHLRHAAAQLGAYNGETQGYDVHFTFDPTTPYAKDGKRTK